MPKLRMVLPMFLTLCCVAGSAGSAFAQDVEVVAAAQPAPVAVERSAPFPASNIRPTLFDFVTGLPLSYRAQVAATPKLMRPPFADQPIDKPKGLAYKIKAEQVDVKNRVKAVRFLGQQDCMDANSVQAGKPPQPGPAQDVLIKTMQSDPSEVVRYEAVLALENQLSRGPYAKVKRNARGRYENCLGCCNEIVLTALSQRAYDTDPAGCPIEPSERVRLAAINAMTVCGIDCNVGPVADPASDAIQVPPVEPVVPTPVPAEPEVIPETQN